MPPVFLAPVLAAALVFTGAGPSGVQYGVIVGKSYDPTPWSEIHCPNHRGCTRTEHPDCWRLDVELGPLSGSTCVDRARWGRANVGDWS